MYHLILNTVKRTLKEDNLSFSRPEKNRFRVTVTQGKLLFEVSIEVLKNAEILRLECPYSFNIKPDPARETELAIAISLVNKSLAIGCFEYRRETGTLLFRMATTTRGNRPTRESVRFMIELLVETVADYYARFFLLSEELLSLEDFMKELYPEKNEERSSPE